MCCVALYVRCGTEFPDVCGGIRFRYIEKKRGLGAEGGWENPFPSGAVTYMCTYIQTNFALIR